MAEWGWDPRSKAYRDLTTGRYLGRKQALSYVEQSIAASSNSMDTIAALVSSGGLGPAEFAIVAREEIKQEYIRQYLLGIGGEAQMTQADWGSIGGSLAEQYKYFDKFAEQVANGELSEDQIRARLRMYTNSAREAYDRAHGKNAKSLDMTEESWITDSGLENCDDCLAYEAEGWQPIGTFPHPGDGTTKCKTNCGCHKEYRNPETGKTY